MDKNAIFRIFKKALVKSHLNNNPNLKESELSKISADIDENVSLETPLSELGLDSMTMTWIVVRLEEELDIDASGVSFFEIYDVNALLEEMIKLKE